MPHSLACVYIHLVFSTKHRQRLLSDAIRPALHAYMATILKNLKCPPLALNSVEDHIHILFRLSRTVALCRVVERVKSTSSKWVKTQDAALSHFAWQEGYGAFSVSKLGVENVRMYIARQREHHRRRAFKAEYLSMLKTHNLNYDERYVWD